MENKEITIGDLAAMMKAGFENTDKKMDANLLESNRKTDEEIEKLAAMINKSFDGIDEKIGEVKIDIREIKEKLTVLERGQEDIKLRQDNSAYRFELQEQEKTLEKHDARIGVLEKKFLVAG
jgi:septal ring factor EnvC (AmiA/AmiB activator)